MRECKSRDFEKTGRASIFSRRQFVRKCNNKHGDFLEKFRRDWVSRSISHDFHPPLKIKTPALSEGNLIDIHCFFYYYFFCRKTQPAPSVL